MIYASLLFYRKTHKASHGIIKNWKLRAGRLFKGLEHKDELGPGVRPRHCMVLWELWSLALVGPSTTKHEQHHSGGPANWNIRPTQPDRVSLGVTSRSRNTDWGHCPLALKLREHSYKKRCLKWNAKSTLMILLSNLIIPYYWWHMTSRKWTHLRKREYVVVN